MWSRSQNRNLSRFWSFAIWIGMSSAATFMKVSVLLKRQVLLRRESLFIKDALKAWEGCRDHLQPLIDTLKP